MYQMNLLPPSSDWDMDRGTDILTRLLIYTRLHSVTSQETAGYVLYVFKLTMEVLMKVDELRHALCVPVIDDLCFSVYWHRLNVGDNWNKWFVCITIIFYAVWFSGSVPTTISDTRVCSEDTVSELYFSTCLICRSFIIWAKSSFFLIEIMYWTETWNFLIRVFNNCRNLQFYFVCTRLRH